MAPGLVFVLAVLAFLAFTLWRKLVAAQREAYIRNFEFPMGLFERLRKQRPELSLKDCQLVAHALRQFFLSHLKSGKQFVSMPSQVADDLWHEFILYTRNYQQFCDRAFGTFMHHTPAVALGKARNSNIGLRRCFWFTCKEENINPRKPMRLPLLFAIDTKLGIADGFRYVADCDSVRRAGEGAGGTAGVYCGGDFGSASFDGGTDGFGDVGGGGGGDVGGPSGDGGGGDGGCGGGGCGGGE
ncbi:hypothetical protein GHT07_08470 [Caenimonas koreensis DSM 17982]|uniref:TIGR04222 domain-containing protein n=1 Tax=Caenimonas koreensis DSM 17982 TaxID=1121255 RepID=A0A844B213_9BURK|nr:hypothetical protein [Caenimonas koreensis]MRD47312.1 hypothetical protein [Caenimonas koreensis DSM 17982]